MFFYVDESGHTGNHLFDPDQPMRTKEKRRPSKAMDK